MNILHLNPTDVLFFRDGRPMEGGASGHGAAWPMPHVINAAFHAALHRADIADVHEHRIGRSSERDNDTRNKKFGSLTSVGPFPVNQDGQWFFPRPADAQTAGSSEPSLHPLSEGADDSSLQNGLRPVVNAKPPSKDKPEPWMTLEAWQAYLSGDNHTETSSFTEDSKLSLAEHQIGIAIDPDTDTTIEGKFYSASYLRLRPGWKLGMMATAQDKIHGDPSNKRDLIASLLAEKQVVVGGQQRTCSVEISAKSDIPLPLAPQISGTRVKWTLLTPAVFPQINDHLGGWLPSWIDKESLQVQLLDGPGKNKARRMRVDQGKPIHAKLVAAVIPRSIPITGWALGDGNGDEAGAKSTHLAVPAGAVYYFKASDEDQAKKLATALNWNGDHGGCTRPACSEVSAGVPPAAPPSIVNRRSTLFGEKGFGLGVCSEWQPYEKKQHNTNT